jgi:hypothetical protein
MLDTISSVIKEEQIEDSMLSTIDNPYNPFTHFEEWYAFDMQKGYNSCGYLARIARTSDELSELDNDIAIDTAIDEIVSLNILGIYIKVTRNNFIVRKV